MKVFLTKYIADGGSFRKQVLRPVLSMVVFVMLFAVAVGVISASMGGVRSAFIRWMIVLLLVVLAGLTSAVMHYVGVHANRNALVFCLNKDGNLFAVDARNLAPSYGGTWRTGFYFTLKFFKVVAETEAVLQKIAEGGMLAEDLCTGKIETYGQRIIKVNKLEEVSGSKYAVCDVIMPNGMTCSQRYDVSDHQMELTELLSLRSEYGAWDNVSKTYRRQIGISIALLLVCLVLCVLSYPTVGILPQFIYYPCLFALYIPIIMLVLFMIKRRRGE